jgi:cytochrome P450
LLRDPAVHLRRLQQTYGDIVRLGPAAGAPVIVFAPEYNHQLLSNPDLFYSFDTSDSASPAQLPRNSAAARLMSGVAGMNGEKHTQHRRMLMPAFHKKRIEGLRDTVVTRTEDHLAGWAPGRRIDLAKEMKALSLRIGISALLGLDPEEEGRHVHHLVEAWTMHGLSIPVVLLQIDLPGLPYHRFMTLSERLETELHAVIVRKRAGGLDGADALSLLLETRDQDGGRLTDSELLGHLTTLFMAGHETTASTLTWLFFLLTQHPAILARLVDECEGVLHGAAPTLDQLPALPLLDRVIKESMRLMPAALWFIRTARAPFTLGPYALPAGQHIVFSPAVTHRRPDIYPDPDRFLPARWETYEPATYEYLPFGGGPRRCLGATFAMMELKLIVPMILQRYRLALPPGTRVDRGGTVLSFPKHPLMVELHPQDGHFTRTLVRGNIHDWVCLD